MPILALNTAFHKNHIPVNWFILKWNFWNKYKNYINKMFFAASASPVGPAVSQLGPDIWDLNYCLDSHLVLNVQYISY